MCISDSGLHLNCSSSCACWPTRQRRGSGMSDIGGWGKIALFKCVCTAFLTRHWWLHKASLIRPLVGSKTKYYKTALDTLQELPGSTAHAADKAHCTMRKLHFALVSSLTGSCCLSVTCWLQPKAHVAYGTHASNIHCIAGMYGVWKSLTQCCYQAMVGLWHPRRPGRPCEHMAESPE